LTAPSIRKDAVMLSARQGRDKRGSLPVAMRNGADATPASWTAPLEPGHLGVQARFVDEDQALVVPAGLGPAPTGPGGGLDVRPILLGGARRFFYSSSRGGRAGAKGR
jgi:hypothetical protein